MPYTIQVTQAWRLVRFGWCWTALGLMRSASITYEQAPSSLVR